MGRMSRSATGQIGEQIVAEAALGLRDPVDEAVVAAVVALQHAAHRGGRQAVVEAHVQQRDAGAGATLHLGHEDHRAAVAAAAGHQHFLLAGDPSLRAEQLRVASPPGWARRATDHHGRRWRWWPAGCRVTLDGVAGVPHHGLDGRVEIGEHLQRAIAQPVAAGAGAEQFLHERTVEHAFVVAADADGDGLGLMLDGVDRPGEFLDGAGERRREIVDDRAGRGDLAGCPLVRLERRLAGDVAQQTDQPHGRGRLEMAVVAAGAQAVEELLGMHADARLHRAQHVVAVGGCGERVLDDLAGLAQRASRGVDGQRRLVAEEVAGHGRQHERQRRIDRRAR